MRRSAFSPVIVTGPQLHVNSAIALRSAVLEGFGIALIAEDLVRDALADGRLVRVFADFDTPVRPMHLLFHADRRLTTKLRSFVDSVVRELGPTESPAILAQRPPP